MNNSSQQEKLSAHSKRFEETSAFYEGQHKEENFNERAGRTNLDCLKSLVTGKVTPQSTLLDLGCGNGSVAKKIFDVLGCWEKYVGIDGTKTSIGQFEDLKLPNTKLVLGDATDLSKLSGKSFDLVLCLFLLQDLSQQAGEDLLSNDWGPLLSLNPMDYFY